jgi:ribosomal protein L37AE/L43A
MKIMHIILIHDDEIVCKKCKNKVLITPINDEGIWSCYKCETKQQVARINRKALSKAIRG